MTAPASRDRPPPPSRPACSGGSEPSDIGGPETGRRDGALLERGDERERRLRAAQQLVDDRRRRRSREGRDEHGIGFRVRALADRGDQAVSERGGTAPGPTTSARRRRALRRGTPEPRAGSRRPRRAGRRSSSAGSSSVSRTRRAAVGQRASVPAVSHFAATGRAAAVVAGSASSVCSAFVVAASAERRLSLSVQSRAGRWL